MNTLKAILVDDEASSIAMLEQKISTYCKGSVKVIGNANTLADAEKLIHTSVFDLAFLDIKIGKDSIFDLLERIPKIDFKIIFVSGHSEFAIKALRLSAVDFLIKPVDIDDLVNAVDKVRQIEQREFEGIKMETLMHNVKREILKEQKLVVKTTTAIYQIKVNEIIRCESDANYTNIILNEKEAILSSKTLKDYEAMLLGASFLRVHQSHLVNMDFIDRFDRRQGGTLVMTNGDVVPISKTYKTQVLGYFDT